MPIPSQRERGREGKRGKERERERERQSQGFSLHTIALIAAIWASSVVIVRLGQVSSDDISMDRGLPQGAPESPLIFTMIMDMVIRSLEPQWRDKGYAFSLDQFRLTAVCYADDIVFAASSMEHLEEMIRDVVRELDKIGLGVGADKTHWTSTPPSEGELLRVDAEEVTWEETLTFVGTVIDLRGSAGPAIQYRMAQANKAYAKWRGILTCPWLPKAQRIKLLPKIVFLVLLWSSSTWTMTKEQQQKIASWSARMASKVARLRRPPHQEIDQWWRLLHKYGHRILSRHSIDVVKMCRTRMFSWAGHLARMDPDAPAACALRCRGMQWWRWRQQCHKHSKDKWNGPHPQIFKIFRWEEQISQTFGEGFSEDVRLSTGWLLTAQDREAWRRAII